MKRLFLLLALAVAALAADLTGTWELQVESDVGTGTPTFTFKQDGNKLSGTYSGQLGEAPVTGTVDGDKVQFSFEISPAGDKIRVTYSGTAYGGNKIKGTVDFGGMGKVTFTGA